MAAVWWGPLISTAKTQMSSIVAEADIDATPRHLGGVHWCMAITKRETIVGDDWCWGAVRNVAYLLFVVVQMYAVSVAWLQLQWY